MRMRTEYAPASKTFHALVLIIAFTLVHNIISFGIGGLLWISPRAVR